MVQSLGSTVNNFPSYLISAFDIRLILLPISGIVAIITIYTTNQDQNDINRFTSHNKVTVTTTENPPTQMATRRHKISEQVETMTSGAFKICMNGFWNVAIYFIHIIWKTFKI